MAQQIRRIDPLSAAKVCAVLYGIMGLIFVPFILLIQTFAPNDPSMRGFGTGFAIMVPILYACIGFIFTLIAAALYNLIAGWVGGIEIELA
jgi:hypothetical protein